MNKKLDLRLPADAHAPGRARAAVATLPLSGDTMQALLLLVSELVTNSVRHGGLPDGEHVRLVVRSRGPTLYVEVSDPGTLPVFRSGHRDDGEGGWGFHLTSHLSERWGVTHGAHGTVAWFELPAAPPERGGAAFLAPAAALVTAAAALATMLSLQALPGDVLYPLKRAAEAVAALLPFVENDPVEARLDEVESAIHEPERAEKALRHYVATLKARGTDREQRARLRAAEHRLRALRSRAPAPARTPLERAIERTVAARGTEPPTDPAKPPAAHAPRGPKPD